MNLLIAAAFKEYNTTLLDLKWYKTLGKKQSFSR